ncbi:MAG: (d)CMP kinase [Clostridium sp.]|jgi:cytidylate kinase|nr:(d)CMP kinase [Clostridium sp.]
MAYSIAIDGPVGAGKSTIAKAVAGKLNFVYIDTGAMYRAMALFLLREKISPEEEAAVGEKCREAEITIRYEDGEQMVYLGAEKVNAYLRREEIGNMASAFAKIAAVRRKLVELQQTLARGTNCVMDGRDIGTCVLPGADVKIYLTADSLVRAKRRYDELKAKGGACRLERIRKDIEERDDQDMRRENSPLRQAQDAILVDSSDMTPEEVASAILRVCQQKGIF